MPSLPNAVAARSLRWTFIAVILGIIAGINWFTISIGIFLPDYLLPPRTLSKVDLREGSSIRVIQRLNHFDFYTTSLIHRQQNGIETNYTILGDDHCRWRIPLTIIQESQTAIVPLGKYTARHVHWNTGRIQDCPANPWPIDR